MIVRMNNTDSAAVGLRLDDLRETTGSSALGRVLTLVIIARTEAGVHDALEAASGAARAHPCRIITILPIEADEPCVDAELRLGSEAGLSEIVVLRCSGEASSDLETLVIPLLLPDTPMVAWWVQDAPENPAATPIGRMAQRRITTAQNSGMHATQILCRMRDGYAPGDTDMAWTGVTFWRNYLAAMLDEPPYEEVTRVVVRGNEEHPAVVLLAAWLALRLNVPVEIDQTPGTAIDGVSMLRKSGELRLDRPIGSNFADMIRPGRDVQRVSLMMRTMESKMIEELREMTPDVAYESVLKEGLDKVLP